MQSTWTTAVILVLLGLVAVAQCADQFKWADDFKCGLAEYPGGTQCIDRPCTPTRDTFQAALRTGQSYESFYSDIVKVLAASDKSTINSRWVDKKTTSPNVFFDDPGRTDCYINVTFVFEVAGYRNQLGYFQFETSGGPQGAPDDPDKFKRTSDFNVIFEETTADCRVDTAKPCLPPGATKQIGPFKGTDKVGWFLSQNRRCRNSDTSPGVIFTSVDNLNWNQYYVSSYVERNFYSSPTTVVLEKLITRNEYGNMVVGKVNKQLYVPGWASITKVYGRTMAVINDPKTAMVYLTFEDIPWESGDEDFNDLIFSVSSNCQISQKLIPCYDQITACKAPQTLLDKASCTCKCPNVAACNSASPYVYFDDSTCKCTCPSTAPVATPAAKVWNSAYEVCNFECPASASTSCSALAPAPAAGQPPMHRVNPNTCACECNPNYLAGVGSCVGGRQLNTTLGVCTCTCIPSNRVCPGYSQYGDQGSLGCDCGCPYQSKPAFLAANPSVTLPTQWYTWNANKDVCNYTCPATPPSAQPGNRVWNSDMAVCDWQCPAQPATPCPAGYSWNSDNATCACQCNPTGSCAGAGKWNPSNATCGCECPATRPDTVDKCQGDSLWDSSIGVCGCQCGSAPLACAAGKFFNASIDSCKCECGLNPPSATYCSAPYAWRVNNPTDCDCACPSSAPTPCVGSASWDSSNATCACKCSVSPQNCSSISTNSKWNSSDSVCACQCEPQPCSGSAVFDMASCECVCPSTPPTAPQSNLAFWNSDPTVCDFKCAPKQYECAGQATYNTTYPGCGCTCPASPPSACPPNYDFNNAASVCDCYCEPKTCTGLLLFNSTSCQCECPSTGTCEGPYRQWVSTPTQCGCDCPATSALKQPGATRDCPGNLQYSSDNATCGCYCPATAAGAGVTCPENYEWNSDADICACQCLASATCSGSPGLRFNTLTCSCECPLQRPSDFECPNSNYTWVSTPDFCGCQCPVNAPQGIKCPTNTVWSNTSCTCLCPAEPPAPCPALSSWVSTASTCGCVCPFASAAAAGVRCPGNQEWDSTACACACPPRARDACARNSTECLRYACSSSDGSCALVYNETCAAAAAVRPAQGCLKWTCDDALGCVRVSSSPTCCGSYNATNCTTCADIPGCLWRDGSCQPTTQVVTRSVLKSRCVPPAKTGLTAGEQAGIAVGVVAGAVAGVAGAGALIGAAYMLFRLLNAQPPPPELPAAADMDGEAGADANPFFQGTEVETENALFRGNSAL